MLAMLMEIVILNKELIWKLDQKEIKWKLSAICRCHWDIFTNVRQIQKTKTLRKSVKKWIKMLRIVQFASSMNWHYNKTYSQCFKNKIIKWFKKCLWKLKVLISFFFSIHRFRLECSNNQLLYSLVRWSRILCLMPPFSTRFFRLQCPYTEATKTQFYTRIPHYGVSCILTIDLGLM